MKIPIVSVVSTLFLYGVCKKIHTPSSKWMFEHLAQQSCERDFQKNKQKKNFLKSLKQKFGG
jgi:hypothetical protein